MDSTLTSSQQRKAERAYWREYHLVRNCAHKRAYHSWAEADHAVELFLVDMWDGLLRPRPRQYGRERMIKDGPMLAYQCRICSMWHIGRSSKKIMLKVWRRAGFELRGKQWATWQWKSVRRLYSDAKGVSDGIHGGDVQELEVDHVS